MDPFTQAWEGKRNEWALPDFLKRGLLAGIGTLFMTEEGARSILGELKLPKEAAQFVLQQVSRTKEDLFQMIAKEVREFLRSTYFTDEFRRLLSSTCLQISTTVRFVTDDKQDSVQPRLKTKVKLSQASRKGRPQKRRGRKKQE